MTAPRRVGVKTIEFTPNETGVIPWICWMGMLHRHFEVIADTETGPPSEPSASITAPPPTPTGKPPVAKTRPTIPATYKVAAGDTFSKTANKYGDARRWREIARANRFRAGPR